MKAALTSKVQSLPRILQDLINALPDVRPEASAPEKWKDAAVPRPGWSQEQFPNFKEPRANKEVIAAIEAIVEEPEAVEVMEKGKCNIVYQHTLTKVALEAAVRAGTNLDGIKLAEKKLPKSDLRFSRMRDAELARATLELSDVRCADWRAAKCQGANLTNVQGQYAHFPLISAEAGKFAGANLNHAWLTFARFDGANFFYAQAKDANFGNAKLVHLTEDIKRDDGAIRRAKEPTDLAGANVSGSNFTEANMAGCLVNKTIFTTYTPPMKRKPTSAGTAHKMVRNVAMVGVSKAMVQGYRALVSSNDSDSDLSDADDEDTPEDGDEMRTPNSVLLNRLKSFAESVSRMLLALDSSLKAFLDRHFDDPVINEQNTVITGAQLHKTFARLRQVPVDPKILSAEVVKMLDDRLFANHIPQLIRDMEGALFQNEQLRELTGDDNMLFAALNAFIFGALRNAIVDAIDSNSQAIASILNRAAADVGQAIAKVTPAEYDTYSHKLAANDAANELRNRIRNALEHALYKQVRSTLLASAQDILAKHGGRVVAKLAKKLDFLEKQVEAKLGAVDKGEAKKLMERYIGTGGAKGGLRTALVSSALKAATKYEIQGGGFVGSLDMLKLALKCPRAELTRHGNELEYLEGELVKLKDLAVTSETWLEGGKTWLAALQLCSKLDVEVGTTVLQCIAADDEVVKAIGAFLQVAKITGTVPQGILFLFNDGPSEHIRFHGFKYHKIIARERSRIHRVIEIQNRIVGLIGTGIVALGVGSSNLIFNLYYDVIKRDPNLALYILVGNVGAILLCVALCTTGPMCIKWCCARR